MGAAQRWSLDDYARHGSHVWRLAGEAMDDLAPKAGERILDLGCGCGELTATLTALGCEATGVDSCPDFVAAARRRGVRAYVADGRRLAFEEAFDAVFSNAALHWMGPQEAPAAGVFRALVPGGRFAAEMGGVGNVARLREAMSVALGEIGIDFAARDPWIFPTPEEQAACLEAAGFRVVKCRLRDRPTELPTDARGWFTTFAEGVLSDLPAAIRERTIDRMVALCRPDLCDAEGVWTADYVRLNFVAEKPA